MCNNNCCGMQNDCGCCGMQNNCGSGFGGSGSLIWIILILILFCGFGSFGNNGCC